MCLISRFYTSTVEILWFSLKYTMKYTMKYSLECYEYVNQRTITSLSDINVPRITTFGSINLKKWANEEKKTLGSFLFVSIYFVGYTLIESYWLAGLKRCMITEEHASSVIVTATTPSVLLPPFTVSKCLKDGVSSPEQSSFCPNKPDESGRTSVLGDAHFFTLHCLFTFYYD